MSLRPITPDELKHRVRDWANAVSGSMPLTIPVFHIGPNGRSFFNARDFSQQHGSAVVFGWTIFPEQTVLRAHFYAVVRLNGETFSVTHGNGDSMTFFEDRRNQPRLVHANGAELLHTFHSLVFPEVRPTRQIIVVDPEISESIQMPLPSAMKQPAPPPPTPARERVAIHPSLRTLKRHKP
jgi:hypothetical protein